MTFLATFVVPFQIETSIFIIVCIIYFDFE